MKTFYEEPQIIVRNLTAAENVAADPDADLNGSNIDSGFNPGRP